MQPESENQSSLHDKQQTSIKFQTSHQLQYSVSSSEAQKLQRKVQLQLYLHFERLLPKDYYHYNESSKYYKKQVSKEQNTIQTMEYLTHLRQKIQPLPLEHHQQLLFLIDIYKKHNLLITNKYQIPYYHKASTGQRLFQLSFFKLKQKIDVKQLSRFNNWNHLGILTFAYCGWFNDDDWRALVEHADNFKNLKNLWLMDNKISVVREGDIEQFKSLEDIDFSKFWIKTIEYNQLSGQSKEVLKRLRQKNNKITICFH